MCLQAPQFITFKDGKIGVNFGGYHAGVGFGGLFGGNTAGGLYAEAGTPHGQSAIAGLGGAVAGQNGGSTGGLFAGATAGNGIQAQAGLAGGVNGDNSAAGQGYASAQAGNNYAATGMEGATSLEGSSGLSFSKKVTPVHKKLHTEINIDSVNEVQPAVEIEKRVIHESVQPVVVKEVYSVPQTQVVEKEIIHTHYKPRKHHHRKTAFLGGYIGGQGDIVGPPQIQKRIDVDVDASAHADVAAQGSANGGIATTYTKEVTIQKNPSFFADIFNIPISTLKAVGNFLGNTAANTHVAVQKSAQVQAETDSISSKHEPSSSSLPSSSSSSAHISVETPSASKFIDDILA
ncbi:jg21093, partial [Pararge aegeria aegeria]